MTKSNELNDAGAIILGARKHIFADFSKFQNKDFSAEKNPSKSELPKINFKKLYLNNEVTPLLTILCAIYQHIPRKNTGRMAASWNRRFLQTVEVIKKLINSDKTQTNELLNIVKDNEKLGFLDMVDKVILGCEIGFPGVIEIGSTEIRYANKADFWYYRNSNGQTEFEHEFKSKTEIIDFIKKSLTAKFELNSNTKAKQPKARAKYKIHVLTCEGEIFIGWLSGKNKAVKLKEGFKSVEDAHQHLKENLEELEIQLASLKANKDYWLDGKTKLIRTGKIWTDKSFISSTDLLNELNFRGVQYGKQMTLIDKEKVNMQCFNSMHDLAEVIGFEPKELTATNQLAIAFGARGKATGKTTADAHYETTSCIINITRDSKRGNICHELFHFWDNVIGAYAQSGINNTLENETFASEFIFNDRKQSFLPSDVENAFRNLHKEIYKTELPKRAIAKDLLRSKPYWGEKVEIFARCFELWVHTQIEKTGNRNDFLTSFNYKFESDKDYPYPTRNEMENGIGKAFEGLFKTLNGKHKSLFFK